MRDHILTYCHYILHSVNTNLSREFFTPWRFEMWSAFWGTIIEVKILKTKTYGVHHFRGLVLLYTIKISNLNLISIIHFINTWYRVYYILYKFRNQGCRNHGNDTIKGCRRKLQWGCSKKVAQIFVHHLQPIRNV